LIRLKYNSNSESFFVLSSIDDLSSCRRAQLTTEQYKHGLSTGNSVIEQILQDEELEVQWLQAVLMISQQIAAASVQLTDPKILADPQQCDAIAQHIIELKSSPSYNRLNNCLNLLHVWQLTYLTNHYGNTDPWPGNMTDCQGLSGDNANDLSSTVHHVDL
jgi:hypothetical protein